MNEEAEGCGCLGLFAPRRDMPKVRGYLVASDLRGGRRLRLTISAVEEPTLDVPGACCVLVVKEISDRLICKESNRRTLDSAFGENWIGGQLRVSAVRTRIDGRKTWTLRMYPLNVRPEQARIRRRMRAYRKHLRRLTGGIR